MQLMSNEFNSLQNRLLRSHESSGRPEKREIELSSFPVCQEDTSKKLKKAESEIDKLKSALVDSTRRLVILDERDEEQKSDVQELEARVEKEETRCRGLEREVEGHKAEKAELEHIRDKLQIQAAVKDDEINRLRDSVQKSAEECLELRQSLQRANSAIDAIGNSKDGKENFADSDAKPKGRPPRPRRVLRENQQSSSKKTIMSSPSNTEKALDALDSQSDADPVFESFDDSTIASDSLNSVSSSPKSIRIQAAKMLVWANKAIEKGRGGKSTCSSAGSSNGTELKPNTKDLQVETAAASKPAPSTPVGKPPRGSTKGKRLFQIETSPIVISNMEEVQTPCACQGPMFSGNKDQVEFYLPQLGVACTCGKHKTNRNLNSANATDLTNILRPWQVKFLESLDITMAEQLVIAYSSQGSRLARDMRKWRKKKRLRSVKTKSCEIALHIWARTCRTVVKSVHAQQATGAKVVKKPEFLEISLTSADNRTISTLGGGSFTSFADSVSVAEF
uniref:Uncharacterized protein n=1 Tax=Grammatophora oceanica TaxID=210454 RepID=A0A7S1VMA0_9STRA